MPLAEILAVLMVVAVCVALFAGYPVALTLGGVSLAFALLGHVAGVMNFALLGALPQRIFGVMTNEVLLAIPLFIFMGVMLERSHIAEELLETMGRLFGSLPGGLGISVADRRRAAGRRQGRGRRHHRDHGPDRAADHAAPRLRPAARRRHGGGDRDAGADLSARDRAGAARRPARATPTRRRSSRRASSRRARSRSAICSPARSFPASRWSRSISLYLIAVAIFVPQAVAGDSARSRRAARLRAGAPARRGAGRAARCSSSRCSARSSAASRRRPKRPRSARSAPSCSPRASARGSRGAADAGGGAHHADHQHDLRHPDRRDAVQPGVPRARRRRHGAPRARQSAGRRRRRDPRGDARDVPARLRDGRLRDHLRGGADRGAGAAEDARRRSGLARHHDGDEPADLLHAPAARADAVLPARRRAAGDHHAAHLCRHHSVRADPALRAGGAVVRAGACDLAAACALWRAGAGERA